jgi:hypothetical protein
MMMGSGGNANVKSPNNWMMVGFLKEIEWIELIAVQFQSSKKVDVSLLLTKKE